MLYLKADEKSKFPVYFTCLRYFNKNQSREVGYLVFCPEKCYLSFNPVASYQALAKFDLGLSKGFYLMVIDALKSDLTSKKLRQNSNKTSASMFNYLQKHAFYLANEFRFDDSKMEFTDDISQKALDFNRVMNG